MNDNITHRNLNSRILTKNRRLRLKHADIFRAWKYILLGKKPVLSLEITNKCPLSCPGCYAYQPHHLAEQSLKVLSDQRGDQLISSVMNLLQEKQPLGLFIVGGEPLIRVKELTTLIPRILKMGIQVEVVTSAVIPIPGSWRTFKGLSVVVSIDGLQFDHDLRRKPATYQRILNNIAGHQITVHCTVTSQMMRRDNAIHQFLEFWSQKPEIKQIRMSLFTPQLGESSEEVLSVDQRVKVLTELERTRKLFPKLRSNKDMLSAYEDPPQSPENCIFSKITDCISADLKTEVSPCQIGGNPDCSQCGCVAAVGLEAVGRYRLPGGLPLASVFDISFKTGRSWQRIKKGFSGWKFGRTPSIRQLQG